VQFVGYVYITAIITFVRIRPLGLIQLAVINFDYSTNILSGPLCRCVRFGEPGDLARVRVRAHVKCTTQLNINFKKDGTKTKKRNTGRNQIYKRIIRANKIYIQNKDVAALTLRVSNVLATVSNMLTTVD